MNKHLKLKTSLVLAAMLGLPMAQAASVAKTDYDASKTRIAADYKTDRAACASLAGNAKDICVEQANGKQKVALAELEYAYTGKLSDRTKVQVVRAGSTYAVAMERCDDLAGNVKDVCVKEAKATEIKALADAKAGKQIGEATADAAAVKLDADFEVAAEKCDALAGDAKASCVSNAKARFGKT